MADDALWYSRFHRVIERNGSITILSASEKGIVFGDGQTNGALFQSHHKSVSVFAERVTLCDPDGIENISFGSTEAEVVTLSTTTLVTDTQQVPPVIVVSARGKNGKPNDAGGSDGREAAVGQAGHKLNVFIGQAPSGRLGVNFEARGGHGATTVETGQASGAGGNGGEANVIVSSTWATVIRGLEITINLLGPKGEREFDDSDDDGDGDGDDEADEEKPLPEDIHSRIGGVIRSICRLCEDDDALSKILVEALRPLSDPTKEHTRLDIISSLKDLYRQLDQALDFQCLDVRDSVTAVGGNGGSGNRKAGERGLAGAPGLPGSVNWKVLTRPLVTAGPLNFVPLHPLQCQMQLDKAAALFYFGDDDSLYAAQRVLSRLLAKMMSVLDLDDDKSPTVLGLSKKAKARRTKRVEALRSAFSSQRDFLGIPTSMTDPLGELRRIGNEAFGMLFQLTRTSVDYYGYQNNWTPRQSVKVFQDETESSIVVLKNSEKLFLNLASRLEKAETDEEVRRTTISEVAAGRGLIRKERANLLEQLDDLGLRIFSNVLNAELQRRIEQVMYELEELEHQADRVFEISPESFMGALGNVAKDIKVSNLIKPKKKDKKKKDKDGKGDDGGKDNKGGGENKDDENDENDEDDDADIKKEDKKDEKKEDKKDSTRKRFKLKFGYFGFGKAIWDKSGGELTNLILEGFTSIPTIDGGVVDKRIVARKIHSVVGDLAKVGESARAKLVRDSKTNQVQIDETQEQLLVASKEQIDKFVKDFVGASKIGPQAEKVQEAFQRYADLLADRNHDRVQYNIRLKALVKLDAVAEALLEGEEKLQRDGYQKDSVDQLSQMAQMAEDIFSWNRARTMRLISQYRRAIYLATLSKPGYEDAGGRTSDAALTLPAAKLDVMYQSLHHTLFELQEKAGSDATRYPSDFDNGHGKYVDLSFDECKSLIKYGQLRVTLPAPTKEFSQDDLPEFRGCADVRVYRVRFWLDGIAIKKQFVEKGQDVLVKIGIAHEGDGIYYDRRGEAHAFAHDPVYPGWSYRLLAKPNADGRSSELVESGDIVSDRYNLVAYAAPSPFASWTISLRDLDRERLDLQGVTRGRFEFFGTSRDFYP